MRSHLVPPLRCGDHMCQKCVAIDVRIERYRWLVTQLRDERTLSAIELQIRTLETRKATFHPDDRLASDDLT